MAIRDYKGDIHRDTNVLGDNVYFGNGQGCGTIWFKTVDQARKFIARFGWISGRDSGLCLKCANHYSIHDSRWKNYPEYACSSWKENIKRSSPDES